MAREPRETFSVVFKRSCRVDRSYGNGARMGILRILQRRRARKVFGKYLSPEVIEKLLRETGSEIRPPEVQHFQFVVANRQTTRILRTSRQWSARWSARLRPTSCELLSHITSSLFVAFLGVPFPEGNSPRGTTGIRRSATSRQWRPNQNCPWRVRRRRRHVWQP